MGLLNIGVIGTGRIANRFINEAKWVSGVSVHCAYNPSIESASGFASKYGIPGFSCIDTFLGEVEAVYIATPHENHVEYIKQCLEKGVHVLCEKPMCFSEPEAEELFQTARDKHLVLMEAFKTAYCPGFKEILDLVSSGKIGRIRDVEACFTKLVSDGGREYRGKFAGDFYELGSYPLLAILSILGDGYTDIVFNKIKNDEGVGIYTKAYFKYKDAIATAKTGIGVKSEGSLIISGEKGYIYVPAPWWLTRRVEVRYEDQAQNEIYEFEFEGDGLRYEIQRFCDRVNNRIEDSEMEAMSVGIAKVMGVV